MMTTASCAHPAARVAGGNRTKTTRGRRSSVRRPNVRRGTTKTTRNNVVLSAVSDGEDETLEPTSRYAPTTRGREGWTALETWKNLGVAWSFITPSSSEGRAVIKAAHAANGNKLKGISAWRKSQWDEAAGNAPVTFVDTHTPLPGCRGYRVCWVAAKDMPEGQRRGVVMYYVAAARRFYFEEDIAGGAITLEDVDEASYKSPEEILEAAKRIASVNNAYAVAYASTIPGADEEVEDGDDGEDAVVDEFEPYENVVKRIAAEKAADAADAAGDQGADGNGEEEDASPIQGWNNGVGATPEAMYAHLGLNYDFHGPAGVVNRAIITTVGQSRGMDFADADAWAKQQWIDAAEELGISAEGTHAPLSVVGRGWKVCWVDGNETKGSPAILIWCPDEGKYYSLGAIQRRGVIGGATTDSVIRAVVGVVRSLPSPVGLKEALARDDGFLQLIGHSAAAGAEPSRGDAESNVRVDASYDDSEEGTVYVQVEEEDDEADVDEEEVEDISASVAQDISASIPEDFAEPSAWKDTMQADAPTSTSSDRFEVEPMAPPGFDDAASVIGAMDDLPPVNPDALPQGEFYSRSAGYLSFVEDEFSEDDLMHELGIDRNDMYRGPKDFPDLSQNATPTPTDMRTTTLDLREVSPKGLPKPEETYHAFALDGVDFLVSKTNDGRLDLSEVYSARRDAYGRFVEEAQRLDTSAFVSIPPAYYQDIAWTELTVTNEEDFESGDTIPAFNTTIEKVTKIYLVSSQNASSLDNAFDRRLDFTKPVVLFTAEDPHAVTTVAIGGATSDPEAALIIKDGELYCQPSKDLKNFETVVAEHVAALEAAGPTATAEFLQEVDTEIEARAMEEEEDTPEVDNY